MRHFKHAAVFLFTSALTCAVIAQAPPPNNSGNAPSNRATASTSTAPRRRSLVQHYPYPYPGYYNNDDRAGWRNPGGNGRYLEYYPPGNQFQIRDVDPVRAARFDTNGVRAEEMHAQQIGIARYNSIQNHIDSMARFNMGYGMGVGFFGGYN
jgi:hypothetical protein